MSRNCQRYKRSNWQQVEWTTWVQIMLIFETSASKWWARGRRCKKGAWSEAKSKDNDRSSQFLRTIQKLNWLNQKSRSSDLYICEWRRQQIIWTTHLVAGFPVWTGTCCWITAGLLPVREWFGKLEFICWKMNHFYKITSANTIKNFVHLPSYQLVLVETSALSRHYYCSSDSDCFHWATRSSCCWSWVLSWKKKKLRLLNAGRQFIVDHWSYLESEDNFNGSCCLMEAALIFCAFVALTRFAGGDLFTETKAFI